MMQQIAPRMVGGALVLAVDNGWLVSYSEWRDITPEYALPAAPAGGPRYTTMKVRGKPDYEGGPVPEQEVEVDAAAVEGFTRDYLAACAPARRQACVTVTRVFAFSQRVEMLELLAGVLGDVPDRQG